jgi:hypothetical protein
MRPKRSVYPGSFICTYGVRTYWKIALMIKRPRFFPITYAFVTKAIGVLQKDVLLHNTFTSLALSLVPVHHNTLLSLCQHTTTHFCLLLCFFCLYSTTHLSLACTAQHTCLLRVHLNALLPLARTPQHTCLLRVHHNTLLPLACTTQHTCHLPVHHNTLLSLTCTPQHASVSCLYTTSHFYLLPVHHNTLLSLACTPYRRLGLDDCCSLLAIYVHPYIMFIFLPSDYADVWKNTAIR